MSDAPLRCPKCGGIPGDDENCSWCALEPSAAAIVAEALGEMELFSADALRTGEPIPEPPELAGTPAVVSARLLPAASAERMKRSLWLFVQRSWHVIEKVPLEKGWHLEAVCDHVQWLLTELIKARADRSYKMEVQNLLVNVPPRSLKTLICGVFAPAWIWTIDPTIAVRYLSGNAKVMGKASRLSRKLIGSEWYRDAFNIEWEIDAKNDALGLYANTAGGERYSQTFMSDVTGTGSDILIVDDPHDAEEAESDVKREAAITKYDLAIDNRVNDPMRCARLGVMQRLHQLDWSAYVLSQLWEHLCLPLLCEAKRRCSTAMGFTDPRADGECLHPERFPPEFVATEKAKGAYRFAGQYQQRPSPEGGGMFKKKDWRYYTPGTEPKKFSSIMMSVDAQFSKTGTSQTCIGVAGILKADVYMLECIARKMSFTETVEEIVRLHNMLRGNKRPIRKTLIEKKANGDAILNVLGGKIRGLIPILPEGGKIARASAMQPAVEGGNVYLPRGAEWPDAFIEEHAQFPNGAFDDQVDMLSQLINYLEAGDGDVATTVASWSL